MYAPWPRPKKGPLNLENTQKSNRFSIVGINVLEVLAFTHTVNTHIYTDYSHYSLASNTMKKKTQKLQHFESVEMFSCLPIPNASTKLNCTYVGIET